MKLEVNHPDRDIDVDSIGPGTLICDDDDGTYHLVVESYLDEDYCLVYLGHPSERVNDPARIRPYTLPDVRYAVSHGSFSVVERGTAITITQ